MFGINGVVPQEPKKERPFIVVRLKTTYWQGKNGELNIKRTLRTMKSLSRGHDALSEDISYCGAEDAAMLITNLDQCRDGLYQVTIHGFDEEWEYTLVPYTTHNGD